MQKIVLKDLGLKDYKEVWNDQNILFQEVIDIKLANREREEQEPTPKLFLVYRASTMCILWVKVAISITCF